MKTIYLHIGTFKTGTTSIQYFLSDNRDKLKEKGFLVPSSQLVAHHPLALSLILEHTNFRASWPRFKGTSNELWETLLNEINSSTLDKIIISSEAFCDLVNENIKDYENLFFSILKDYFKNFNVKVICYVRDIDKYSLSMYKEALKIGGITNNYYEELEILIKNESIHIHPSKYLKFYKKLFGEENITVRRYELSLFKNNDIINDFCELLNIPLISEKKYTNNLSIKESYIDYFRAFNSYSHSYELVKGVAFKFNKIKNNKTNVLSIVGKFNDAILEESKFLKDEFNIIMNQPNIKKDLENNEISSDSLFQIILMSYLIKENHDLKDEIKNIQYKLDKIIGVIENL